MAFLDPKIASHDLKLTLLQLKTPFLRLHRSFLHLKCPLLQPHVSFLQKKSHFLQRRYHFFNLTSHFSLEIPISCNADGISLPSRPISPKKFSFLGMQTSFLHSHVSFPSWHGHYLVRASPKSVVCRYCR
jgi:hypothetical protein